MLTTDFNYALPPELIAQEPLEPRDASRLIVLRRDTGKIAHRRFHDLVDYLRSGDLLVANETRVIPARLYARKVPTGGRVELLLLTRHDDRRWEALVKDGSPVERLLGAVLVVVGCLGCAEPIHILPGHGTGPDHVEHPTHGSGAVGPARSPEVDAEARQHPMAGLCVFDELIPVLWHAAVGNERHHHLQGPRQMCVVHAESAFAATEG